MLFIKKEGTEANDDIANQDKESNEKNNDNIKLLSMYDQQSKATTNNIEVKVDSITNNVTMMGVLNVHKSSKAIRVEALFDDKKPSPKTVNTI